MTTKTTTARSSQPAAGALERTLDHALRNGLAGVRGVVDLVRGNVRSATERELLVAAIAELDRLDALLRRRMTRRSGVARKKPLSAGASRALPPSRR